MHSSLPHLLQEGHWQVCARRKYTTVLHGRLNFFTLGCEAGQVAQTLLQRVSEETDGRHMSNIMMLLREVKTAGKLGTLATMLSDGGSLANLRQP